MQQIFTNLVEVATDFVTQNSYAADSRRRSSVGRACGTSIPALKEHLEAEIPNLSLSNSTCARLMVAPHKQRLSSKVYKGLIQAKVPPKQNNEKTSHVDSHYCSCAVKYRMEFAAQFEKEVAIFSCDCMNKVHVGGMAVSRYHQVNRIHMVNDAPNYPDHDFPQGSGYLITPCGYMRLEKVDDDPNFSHDDLGRAHINTPRTGPIHLVNRSQKFNKMTIQEHVNDLIPIIEATCTTNNKTGIVLLVDGGPDWNDASWTVLLYLTRMFRRLNLDFLCMSKYAPKNSALNPIEHGWAPLSKMLTSVRLRSSLDGESLTPAAQSQLTQTERKQKEALVFDSAMKDLNSYWDGQVYNGHTVSSTHHPCLSEGSPYTDYEHVHPLVSTGTKLSSKPELLAEIDFAVKHTYRRPRELSLVKCTLKSCTFCSRNPVRAVKSMEEIRAGRGLLLLPTPSTDFPGHYQTYLELQSSPVEHENEHMPSFVQKDVGSCPHCQCYMFSSKADKRRHLAIIHPTT